MTGCANGGGIIPPDADIWFFRRTWSEEKDQLIAIDTTTPGGKALFQMMGVFAEFERSMIRERVKAGLE